MVNILYSDKFLQHDTGSSHPENSNRLKTIVSHLKNGKHQSDLNWIEPSPCLVDDLLKIHTQQHISHIKSVCENGGGYLDSDTPVSPESYDTALLSAGAWLDGLNLVLKNESAFILSRPPGHHAEKDRPMGFCLFSNAALTATAALENPNIEKVAIFDWDVHHGNGTENIVKSNRDILYTSIHQYPFYPGTGMESSKGDYENVMNIPLPSGCGWSNYEIALHEKILPALKSFDPDLIIVSAGFDAHISDPLAGMNLISDDFGKMTEMMIEIQPKVLFGLEGGYNLNALAESVEFVIDKIIQN